MADQFFRLSFYVQDDLRQEPRFRTEGRFLAIEDALFYYYCLPDDTVKELGMTDGRRTLPLIRRVTLFPGEKARENVLITDQLTTPPWRGSSEVLTAARRCVAELKVRYCLDRNRLVPKPATPPDELQLGAAAAGGPRREYRSLVPFRDCEIIKGGIQP